MGPKRKAILEAALRMMDREQNTAAITVASIAQEAQVGKGTVYEYFKSKEEILLQALFYYLDGLAQQLKELDLDGGFEAGFEKLMKCLQRLSEQCITLARSVVLGKASQVCPADVPEDWQKCISRTNQLVVGRFDILAKQGVKEGLIPEHYRRIHLIYACMGLMTALVDYGSGESSVFHQEGLNQDDFLSLCRRQFVHALNCT
nr:TetR/AcrR family transcriptional regulator [uncultured Solibaculum sp.]